MKNLIISVTLLFLSIVCSAQLQYQYTAENEPKYIGYDGTTYYYTYETITGLPDNTSGQMYTDVKFDITPVAPGFGALSQICMPIQYGRVIGDIFKREDLLSPGQTDDAWIGMRVKRASAVNYAAKPPSIYAWHAHPTFSDVDYWRNGYPPYRDFESGWTATLDALTYSFPYPNVSSSGYSTILQNSVLNTWTDWIIHIKWSYGSDGKLEIFKNGAVFVSYSGANLSVANSYTNYQYITAQQTIYLDEIRFGGKNSTIGTVTPGLTAVPVKFISFAYIPATNSLNWEVVEDTDVEDFVVQESSDGSTWTDIATIPSQNVSKADGVNFKYIFKL